MDEEKRRAVRLRKRIRVAYSLTEEGEAYREVFTEDISESGLQILASEKLEKGQVIRLKIEFVYDSVPILANATVMYVAPFRNRYRVGLEFFDMIMFQKERLKRGLDKLVKDSQD